MSVLLCARIWTVRGCEDRDGGGGGMGGEGEMRQEAMNTSTQWASCRDIDKQLYMVAT